MSQIFPKLEEFYKVIINDCFEIYYELNKVKDNNFKKNVDFVDKIYTLKNICIDNKLKNQHFLDIALFLSIYMYDIKEFFIDKEKKNSDVIYAEEYCLAYIVLIGYKANLINKIGKDELFTFQPENHRNFSNFLQHYGLPEQIRNCYDESLAQIKASLNNDNDIFLNIIKKFDMEYYQKLIEEKKTIKIDNIKSINKSDITSIEVKTNNERIFNLETIMDSLKREILTLKNENNLRDKEIITLKHENNLRDKEIITLKHENNLRDKEIITLKTEIIKSDFEIIKGKYDALATNEQLIYGLIINSSNLIISKRKIDYLENYIKSLKNTINNLSNPYNFNFWRKIANIILKNMFIILKNKNFTIKQNKNRSIYNELKKIIDKKKNPNDKLIKKLNIYLKDLDKKNKNITESLSPSGDKKRVFNLITIEKNKKAEAILSLSIDFLFFLKEVGNKINHFDESVLNYILFNDLTLPEESKNTNKTIIISKDEIKLEKTNKIILLDNSEKPESKNNKKEVEEMNSKEQKNKEVKDNKNQIKEIKSTIKGPKLNEIKKNKMEASKSKSTETKKEENKINKNVIIKQEISRSKESKNGQRKMNEKIRFYKLKNIQKLNEDGIIDNNKLKSVFPKETDKNTDSKNNKIRSNSLKLKKSTETICENKMANSLELKKTEQMSKVSKNTINTVDEKNGEESKHTEIMPKNEEIKIKDKNNNEKALNIEMNDDEINSININLFKEYKGEKTLTANNLVELFKNPVTFQKNNIEKKNLFDSIYKDIDEFKKDIGYEDDEKRIIDLENKSKDLNNKIQELIRQIGENLEKNKIDINNIEQNKNNINMDFKDEINIFLELKKMYDLVEEKIKMYEKNRQKLLTVKNSIFNNENEVNTYINIINERIQRAANIININDIFEEYKKELNKNIKNMPEYQEHSDIFNNEAITNFKIDELYKCLQIYLKDNEYSIAKRDITNYNLFIEILNDFNELFYIYQDNVDVKLL